ncbi:MAG TPA: endonuclease/exonuclease/phosphatase family protein [Caulobacteraceae bacterium]|nr:endonuclease/exonuclease/phosphatase family protein [Caulobacteraceae bacterium]
MLLVVGVLDDNLSNMNPIRILAAASAMELAAATATLSALGLAGSGNGWLDVINSFAPVILATALVAAGLAFWTLDGATRLVTIGLAMIAVAYGLALTQPEFAGLLAPHATGGPEYQVLSANVWRDNPWPDRAVAEILKRDADAVLLQESDGSIQGELARLKAQYPYASVCAGAGVQIFVKFPIVAHGCGMDPGSAPPIKLVWIQTLAPGGRRVTLASTHFSWPFPPGPQELERANLAERLRQLPERELILGGDFNTTPWSFAGRRMDKLLAPLRRRTIALFSWPARLDPLRQPWSAPVMPIDHIYTGADWGVVHIIQLRLPGSDHFATEAVLARSS